MSTASADQSPRWEPGRGRTGIGLVTLTRRRGTRSMCRTRASSQGRSRPRTSQPSCRRRVVHSGVAARPLVHVVARDEDCACTIEGRVTLAGDEKRFASDRPSFRQRSPSNARREDGTGGRIDHHALQMRTLQVRFTTPGRSSDYTLKSIWARRVVESRRPGATVAKPLPCEEGPARRSSPPSHP